MTAARRKHRSSAFMLHDPELVEKDVGERKLNLIISLPSTKISKSKA
jgi:hypothetical protein